MLRKCLPTTQSASQEDWHLPSLSLARYSRGWLPPPWADVLAVEEDWITWLRFSDSVCDLYLWHNLHCPLETATRQEEGLVGQPRPGIEPDCYWVRAGFGGRGNLRALGGSEKRWWARTVVPKYRPSALAPPMEGVKNPYSQALPQDSSHLIWVGLRNVPLKMLCSASV